MTSPGLRTLRREYDILQADLANLRIQRLEKKIPLQKLAAVTCNVDLESRLEPVTRAELARRLNPTEGDTTRHNEVTGASS